MFIQHDGFEDVTTFAGQTALYNAVLSTKDNLVKLGDNKTQYYNVPASFDIETTSFIHEGKKVAIMYIWQFGLNGFAFYGRDWQSFYDTIAYITTQLELTFDQRLIIFSRNLGFEFSFIMKRLKWKNLFAITKRKPIYAVTEDGLEFRCSYIESGESLEETGKNLTKYPIQKMAGDLDYSLLRHSETPLSDKEFKYCENDVRVDMAHIAELIDEYCYVQYIPLTNTGKVRSFCRNACFEEEGYTDWIKELRISRKGSNYSKADLEQYDVLTRAFRGGVAEASPLALIREKPFDNAKSDDMTSSYPTVMVSELYPMSRATYMDYIHGEKDLEWVERKGMVWVADVMFINIRPQRTEAFYLKKDKCQTSTPEHKGNALFDNGGLVYADRCLTTITNVDFDIIRQNYVWDDMIVDGAYVYKTDYLPKPLIESVIHFYEEKTRLKGVKGKEAEYQKAKGMLNSLYGMIVTSFMRPEVNFDYDTGTWLQNTPVVPEQALKKYNYSNTRFLYYPWGVWITAYARHNLFSAIFECGDDFLYCDTDSVKYINGDKHQDFFVRYNKCIDAKIDKCLNHYGISVERARPFDVEGKIHPLGWWDPDGEYEQFKTLGAKRYMYKEKGKYKITVAGIPKSAITVIMAKAYLEQKDPFDVFNIGLQFEAGEIKKNEHTYFDEHIEGELTDYIGNTAPFSEESGTYIGQASFEMSVDPEFAAFVDHIKTDGIISILGEC